MKRKVSLFLLLTLALSTVLMSGLLVNAKEPLYCEKSLYIFLEEPHFRGWISGDINGYFCVYSLDPPDECITGQVVHYREEWAIFSDDTMTVLYMSGSSKALSNAEKMEFQGQGVVEWVDENGPYADLLGCQWHARGIFVLEPVFHLEDTYFRMS